MSQLLTEDELDERLREIFTAYNTNRDSYVAVRMGLDLIESQKRAHASKVVGDDIPHDPKCKEYSNSQQIDKFCICFARQQNMLIRVQRERNSV
jgi:hypothetical protein